MAGVPRTRTEIGKAGASEGAALLWRAIGSESLYAASKTLGVTQAQLSNWLYCDRRPDAKSAARIQDTYGVPADAWGRDPVKPFAIPEPPCPEDTGSHRISPARDTG